MTDSPHAEVFQFFLLIYIFIKQSVDTSCKYVYDKEIANL